MTHKVHIPEDELRELYSNEKLTPERIAQQYECGESTVRRLLQEFKIPLLRKKGIEIPEADLRDFYLNQKRSAKQIAKHYGYSVKVIQSRLHSFGIPMRTISEARRVGRVEIPEDDLRELYLQQKVSTVQIAERYGSNPATVARQISAFGIPLRTLSEAKLVQFKIEEEFKDFGGDLLEKAYLIGFRTGDLHVVKRAKGNGVIRVACGTSRIEQVELIKNLFAPYGHINVTEQQQLGHRLYQVNCSLNKSFSFLLERCHQVPNWILESDDYFSSFFAGYVDAEGTFSVRKQKNYPTGIFGIATTDKGIIEQSRESLIALGISCTNLYLTRKIGRKDVYAFQVAAKESLRRLIALLSPYVRHSKRREDMQRVKGIMEKHLSKSR